MMNFPMILRGVEAYEATKYAAAVRSGGQANRLTAGLLRPRPWELRPSGKQHDGYHMMSVTIEVEDDAQDDSREQAY